MRELYCFIIFLYVLVEYQVISSLGYLQNNSRLCYVYHFQIVTCASHEGIFWYFFLSHDMKLHKELIIMSRQILNLLIFGKNVIFMRWRPWIIFCIFRQYTHVLRDSSHLIFMWLSYMTCSYTISSWNFSVWLIKIYSSVVLYDLELVDG